MPTNVRYVRLICVNFACRPHQNFDYALLSRHLVDEQARLTNLINGASMLQTIIYLKQYMYILYTYVIILVDIIGINCTKLTINFNGISGNFGFYTDESREDETYVYNLR